MKIGPIGKGFVQEVKTKRHGTRFVARWNAYEQAPDGSIRRVQCGPHELGSKVTHGPGLKSLKDAQKAWDQIYRDVFKERHPDAYCAASVAGVKASSKMAVADFIKNMFSAKGAYEECIKVTGMGGIRLSELPGNRRVAKTLWLIQPELSSATKCCACYVRTREPDADGRGDAVNEGPGSASP